MNTERKIPLILDGDPGHDDAIAWVLAASDPRFEIKAITAVAGNQTLAKTVNNALKVTQHLDIDVDVYAGNARPLVREPMYAGFIHGIVLLPLLARIIFLQFLYLQLEVLKLRYLFFQLIHHLYRFIQDVFHHIDMLGYIHYLMLFHNPYHDNHVYRLI